MFHKVFLAFVHSVLSPRLLGAWSECAAGDCLIAGQGQPTATKHTLLCILF